MCFGDIKCMIHYHVFSLQAQLPELTARLCSQFCFSAHISPHEFNVQHTLFEAVFHSHLKENTKWEVKKNAQNTNLKFKVTQQRQKYPNIPKDK